MKLPIGFDIHALEVFTLTAELGGMTQSAEHLGMTQSAVSQIISKLENALDTKLFDRSMRPLALTTGGRFLLNDGVRLVTDAKKLALEVRSTGHLPIESVTIAMAESMANLVTAPLLIELSNSVTQSVIRSGVSPVQHEDFLNRKMDMLITAGNELDSVNGLDQYPILQEEFVLVFPAKFYENVDSIRDIIGLPFIRYSLLSAVGIRIESQLSRMRANLKNSIEVDTTIQQLSAVGQGLGWSITTPMCLACHPNLLSTVRIEPMKQAQFQRYFRLIARHGEFGDLPLKIAKTTRSIIHRSGLVPLFAYTPWLASKVRWPDETKLN